MSTKSWKCMILSAFAVLALVYAGFVSVSSANEDQGFQPVGAWFWTITVPGTSFGAPALITLHGDGTVSVSPAAMFMTPSGGKMSPGHGVWERTGHRSFGGTTLYMSYDSVGAQNGFIRARTALSFAGDSDHIEGLMYLDYCPGCTDPLGENGWTSSILRNVSGTRIQRVEVPE